MVNSAGMYTVSIHFEHVLVVKPFHGVTALIARNLPAASNPIPLQRVTPSTSLSLAAVGIGSVATGKRRQV